MFHAKQSDRAKVFVAVAMALSLFTGASAFAYSIAPRGGPPIYYNGHYYEQRHIDPGSNGETLTWDALRGLAHSLQFAGMQGHLMTVTTCEERSSVPGGGLCAAVFVDEKWLWGDGPEAGQLIGGACVNILGADQFTRPECAAVLSTLWVGGFFESKPPRGTLNANAGTWNYDNLGGNGCGFPPDMVVEYEPATTAIPPTIPRTDWTSIEPSTGQAQGTLGPASVTLSGAGIVSGVVDGSSTAFSDSPYCWSLPSSDLVEITGTPGGSTYSVTFSRPVRSPLLLLASLGSTLEFSNVTVTRVCGDYALQVEGTQVMTAPTLGEPTLKDVNGAIQLIGDVSSFSFTARTPSGQVQSENPDQIMIQITCNLATSARLSTWGQLKVTYR